MSLSNEGIIVIDMAAAVDQVLFTALEPVDLESIVILTHADAGIEAVNFTTISILDAGIDGDQTDVVASLTTFTGGIALTGRVKQEIALAATGPYRLNYGLAITKADDGAAVNLGVCLIGIKVRMVG